MTLDWSDDDMARLERVRAAPATARLAAALALTVEDALRPALHGGRVRACEHVTLGAEWDTKNPRPVAVDRCAFLCPMHPERLVCDAGTCVEDHYAEHHGDEHETAGCFVCKESPIREDFTPVFAEILLHRNVNLEFPEYVMPDGIPLQNIGLAYGGVLLTLPVAYLCPEHACLVELPIRMAWPTEWTE